MVFLVAFYFVELRTPSPLIEMSIFRIRAFLVENLVLGIAMLVFVPVFFFASEYAQIALGKTASQAGLYLLYFFIGFVIASQIGGRMLDRRGAKRPVVIGCALAAVGFDLWAGKVTAAELHFADVVRHPGRGRHGAHAHAGQHRRRQPRLATSPTARPRASPRRCGTTPPVWDWPSSGPSWCRALRSRIVSSSVAQGRPRARPTREATNISQAGSGGSGNVASIPHFVRLDFAYATRNVLHVMARIMIVAAVVAFVGLRPGVQEESAGAVTDPARRRCSRHRARRDESGRGVAHQEAMMEEARARALLRAERSRVEALLADTTGPGADDAPRPTSPATSPIRPSA